MTDHQPATDSRANESSNSSVPTHQIAVAVIEHGGQFIVGCRRLGVAAGGFWEFPGGKVQQHETVSAAAIREVREETGLTVTIQCRLDEVTVDDGEERLQITFFRCIPQRLERLRPPFRWVDRSRLAQLEFPPANRRIIELLRLS